MSGEGMDFLVSRGRPSAGAMGMLDMLGRQAPAPDQVQSSGLPPDPSSVPGEPPRLAPAPTATGYRIVVSYGRGDDEWVVGLERAPDWELDQVWKFYNGDITRGIVQVVSAMLGPRGVKDYTGEVHVLGPQAIPNQSKNAATGQVAARQTTTRAKANSGRGGKNRAASPAVGQRPVASGPAGQGQAEPLVPGEAGPVPEARGQGG